MGLFSKAEVTVIKETSDLKDYLNRLVELRQKVDDNSEAATKIDKEIAVTEAGIYGEDSILFELKNSGLDLVVLRDLYIETDDGRSAQIDFFVVTPYVNVFIECKNLFGNIEITNKGDFIRTFEYKGRRYKEGIYSPITQNERHMTVYKDCRKTEKNVVLKMLYEKNFFEFNRSVVVLANPKTVVNDRWAKKEVKDQVIRADQLINYLSNVKSSSKYNIKTMLEYAESVLAMNVDSRKDYLEKYEELLKETESVKGKECESTADNDKKDRVCPRCGGKLVIRTAKTGINAGNKFYGCSNYPKCHYIENII